MSSQKEEFRSGEGDAWFARNRAAGPLLAGSHSATALLRAAGAAPANLLEIGCSNGAMLASLCSELGCAGAGIDPSSAAIAQGRERFPALRLEVATAERLPFADAQFDCVVFGFCLYLCDRDDLFRIAAEAHRVLADPGWLLVTDFLPPFAYRNRYSHRAGIDSFKMDYSRLFTWNPEYVEVRRELFAHAQGTALDDADARMGHVLIRRNGADAWPLAPFGR